ncbi:MAG: dockerin type I domain-containing protein [Candidatus Dojkabacteria bacterium]
MLKRKYIYSSLSAVLIVLVAISTVVYAQPQANVTVSSSIQACLLDMVARPEQRVPPINNWDSTVSFVILDNSNLTLASFTVPTDTQGLATYDFCANTIFPVPGTYKFYATGFSHLRKRFTGVSAFNTYHDSVNLTGASNFLVAGEVSNSFDNKVNSLDLAYLNSKMGSADNKADLNQDGIVNSLDVTIERNNQLKLGDPIP